MKILQITNKVPVPPKDGGSIATYRLSQGLINQGQEVHLLAMNTSKHFVPGEVIESYEKDNFSITAVNINTRIKPLKAFGNLIFSRLPYNAVRFLSKDFEDVLVSLLHQIKPGLIIIENLYPAAYLKLIRENSDSPVVYRAHNIESEIWERTAINSKGIKKWYIRNLAKRIKRLETLLINKYDLLVPITERDSIWFSGMGNLKPTFVLPTGYYINGGNSAPAITGEPTIAHLGALDWHPNQEGLLWFVRNIMPELRNKIPGLKFHIAGRNSPAWFKKEITREGIVFHGEIEDAATFITKHPVHVVPLFSGSGMRIKIIEAMAYGRAVVTTTLGTEGIPTENGRNILVADGNSNFLDAVMKVLGDREYCLSIGENAFNFVKDELDNDRLVARLLSFLKENL
jgi:glycosyltransferase involved in cell wall biosynthesis